MPPQINSQAPLGNIIFYEFFEPPLDSGNYSVSVTQTATSSDPAQPVDASYESTLSFAVLGPRFSLPAPYIHAQFPPPDAQGEYANVLPHIVFARKTLPWQRLVDSEDSAGGPVYPWLALLTFDLNDPIPPLQSGTLEVFQSPPEGTITYPGLTLDVGESWADPCQYIDVPAALFYNIAPTLSDLRWLAHAREIDRSAAIEKPGGGQDGKMPQQEFSVVVSNRLPSPGTQTQCCLVSLEDMSAYLPTTRGTVPAGVSTVRLAVLASWTFAAVALPETFAQYFAGLNNSYQDVITPQIPYANATGTPNATVQNALAMSYTALNHHTRQGADTVSWYRGPFLPYVNPLDVAVPSPSADALVHYDPETGMLDESLAAAWQIGQLLALNDKQFSTLLYSWKRGQTQAAVTDFETRFLAGQIAVDPALISTGARPILAEVINEVVKPLLQQFLAGGAA